MSGRLDGWSVGVGRANPLSRRSVSSLQHAKVRNFTSEVASRLNIPKSFADFVLGARPECFEYYCKPADNGWTCFVPEDVDEVFALWSCSADQTLLIVSAGKVAYANGFHDVASLDIVAKTPRGLLAKLFIALYESEYSHSELSAAASFADFPYLDECILFQRQNGGDYQNWHELLAGLISDIDSRPF